MIAASDPEAKHPKDATALVGLAPDGQERRLLLYFPGIEQLYSQDVVLSSITSIEIVVTAAEVKALASRYGDPVRVLADDWIIDMPGVSAPGSYEEYAKDPWKYEKDVVDKAVAGRRAAVVLSMRRICSWSR